MRGLNVRTAPKDAALVLGSFFALMGKEQRMDKKEEQFEKIYKEYSNTVYKFCLYYLNDEAKAKEITVDVFNKLYRFYNTIAPQKIFTYLMRETKAIINITQQKSNK